MKPTNFQHLPSGCGSIAGADLWRWWRQARQEAIAHQVPPQEVDWLLLALTDLDRLSLRLETFREQEAIALAVPAATLPTLWQRRCVERVPVQYLVGQAPWRNFVLQVSPAVLIPRPETECLIDLAEAAVKAAGGDRDRLETGDWVDLGTGSGAIALGLAEGFPQARIHAVDCSSEALAIAQRNVRQYGLGDRIGLYQGDWFAPLERLRGQLSGMVSNPPYIPHKQVFELQPEVTHHEPHLALDGGGDGLDCVRLLVDTAPLYLQSGGFWLVELMAGQAATVVRLLEAQGSYRDVAIASDLSGIERFVQAWRI